MRRGRETGGPGRAGRILVPGALCLLVAAVASIPAGVLAAAGARREAAESLRARAEQLTRALAAFSTTRVAMRQEGYLTIGDVTTARQSMPEALSVTITGPHQNEIYNSERCSVRDYVLASDEASWEQVLEEGSFRPGNVTASDEVARKGVIADFQREVEQRLGHALGELVQRYRDGQQALGLEIDETLSRELTAMGAVRSYPAFDQRRPAPSYIFYAPIAFFDPTVDYFCSGMVRLTVDTSSLGASAARAGRRAWIAAGGFGLLALCLGAGGAVLIGFGLPGAPSRSGKGRTPGAAAEGRGGKDGR